MINIPAFLLMLVKTPTPNSLAVMAFLFVSTIGLAQSQEILIPIHDAYLENGVRKNDETLRVENGSRVRETYLMFDLSGINGIITDLNLALTVYTDPGSGTINVYKGIGNNWTENNLSSTNKPTTSGTPLGSFTGSHTNNSIKTLVLNPSILDDDFLSLVLKHTTNSDVAFASTGPETSSIFDQAPSSKWPKLTVTFTPTTDTQDPTAPTNLTNPSIADNKATLNWTGSTDNVGVIGYNIYNQGVFFANAGNAASYETTTLTEGATYQFTVVAYDAANNLSNPSNTVSVTIPTSSSGGDFWSQTGTAVYYEGGNVGIGTSSPDQALAVKGKIHTQEVIVDLQGAVAPDYVFYKDYPLRSLEAVQKHIDEHGHLPNIPSAQEMQDNGIELKEMNLKLLEKVEELTLYILEQNKRIDQLESQINSSQR
ncbi:MAG: hypothetical protein ABJN95_15900 [Maribacter sp.]|uniref:CBM96 family carbohydrate-binding protein n=1 Tax=Maribacter sp. TaxID=1897614 RepID=UPI003298F74B